MNRTTQSETAVRISVITHPKSIISFIVLAASAAANFVTGTWIQSYFSNESVSPDLILHMVPYIPAFHTIAELLLFLNLVVLAYVVYTSHFLKLPHAVSNLATVYAVRALLITLTPLAQTSPLKNQPNFYGATFSGMYPSGHIALSTIIYLLVRKYGKHPAATKISKLLIIAQGSSLFLSHSHYGIDIVGGMMMAYVTYRWMVRFEKKLSINPM